MIRELSAELAQIAKTELNENPKQTPNDVKHLKEWILKQPHLRARTDDQWLVAILRGCKFSLERVKAKLDLYYTLRTTSPEVTLRLKPTERKFVEFMRLGTCIILPKSKTELHPRVILIRAGRYNPEEHSVADIMCILYYLVQILVIEDDTATVVGTKIVVDYEGVTINHLTQATSLLRKIVAVSQGIPSMNSNKRCGNICGKPIYSSGRLSDDDDDDRVYLLLNVIPTKNVFTDSLPLRLKGSHHLNVPSGIEVIFKLVSTFLNEKARQRLKIHKSANELFEHISKEIVPSEYGGTGSTVAEIIEFWVAKIKEYKSWMEVEETLGTDESRRPGKPISNDVIGDQGSFRQLAID